MANEKFFLKCFHSHAVVMITKVKALYSQADIGIGRFCSAFFSNFYYLDIKEISDS